MEENGTISPRRRTSPGPWIVTDDKQQVEIWAQDHALAVMVDENPTWVNKYRMGDAYLIGRAPDLLRILKVLVDHAQEKYPHFEDARGMKEIAEALAVIERIEGVSYKGESK